MAFRRCFILKKRADFKRVQSCECSIGRYVVVCSRLSGYHHLRVGFTVSKRMGNAVVRNRCKRRLREVAYILLKDTVAVPRDYVFIARKELFNAPWKAVVSEISKLIYVRQAC